MDSFATLSVNKPHSDVPQDNEGPGTGSGGGYCVIAARENDVPVNREDPGTGSGGGYCVIA